MRSDDDDTLPVQRRRLWPVFVAPALMILLAIGWSVFWFYGAGRIEGIVDQWQAREASAGRVYQCGRREIGGYPFRFEARCDNVRIDLPAAKPPLQAQLANLLIVAQIYDPGLLIAQFASPMQVALQKGARLYTLRWTKGEASLRGKPKEPERVSLVLAGPQVEASTAAPVPLMQATSFEAHGRIASGNVRDNPVLEIVLRTDDAQAGALHPLLATPFSSDVALVLKGLKDFAPKPWPARFREIHEAGGSVQVVNMRIVQGDALVVAGGVLQINANGRLDGRLDMTVVGLEKIVAALGLEQMIGDGVSQSQLDRLAPGMDADKVNNVLNTLDTLIPGLRKAAKERANAGLVSGVALLGKPTMLEGRKAIALPLKLADGEIYLGPLKAGKVGSLF